MAALTPSAHSQLHELLSAGQELLGHPLDTGLLQRLAQGDTRQVEAILRELVEVLEEDEIAPLGDLEEWVDTAIPLLQAHTETRPYAAWLRARADYFEVADQLTTPAPSPAPPADRPRTAPVSPTPNQARAAWTKEVQGKPQPTGAVAWVPKLKPVFRKSGVPPELVWLAELESGFEPKARSPVGAAGMYQLMPATAQDLGLKTAPSDERLVPEKNARAAADYLRQLHRQFKDWRLTLAAYNAGPGRVTNTLKQRRASTFDAIAPSLPAETQMYVPKFEALLRKREGKALASLKLPTA
ncbi:MAG: lytic transglycosylase domain-containing protein [Verrucomicrobiales bacterium]|nr:lytic transglycosylase domain-containing protein [Verrucomicrobiales bacterium]